MDCPYLQFQAQLVAKSKTIHDRENTTLWETVMFGLIYLVREMLDKFLFVKEVANRPSKFTVMHLHALR